MNLGYKMPGYLSYRTIHVNCHIIMFAEMDLILNFGVKDTPTQA